METNSVNPAENVVTIIENTIKSVVYNVVNDNVDEKTYRVSLESPIKGYRTVNGVRSEANVISFLIPRNVLLAQVLNKLPMLARIYDASKKKFELIPENEGKIMPFVEQLNTYLKGGKVTLRSEFHAGGEIQTLDDGREVRHEKDKYNIEILNVDYGPIGAATVNAIEAAELERAVEAAKAALGL